MILRLMSLGIPVAGFFAAGVIAAQAEPARAPAAPHKVIKLHVVKDGDAAGDSDTGGTLVIDGKDVAADVDEVVSEAIAEAIAALKDADAEIRVELDGKKLKAMSEKHRKALAKARKELEEMGENLADRMAEVDVHVEMATKEAAAAAKKAGKALHERRVIVLRDDDGKEAELQIRSDGDGRTVVVIKGDNVKVITPAKRGESEKTDTQEE